MVAVVTHGSVIGGIDDMLMAGRLPVAAGHPPIAQRPIDNCAIKHLTFDGTAWAQLGRGGRRAPRDPRGA